MDRINFDDQRIKVLLEKSEESFIAQKECINIIDVSSLSKESLGEAKLNYHKCMNEKGFGNDNFTYKHTRSYNF